MIWQLYSFLILVSFILLIVGLTRKSADKGTGENNIVGGTIALLLIAAILFGAVALYSFEVTYVECENQIGWMNVTADNVTRLTNNIGCKETNYNYDTLGYFFGGICVVCFVLAFYYAISLLSVGKSTYDR